MQENIVRMEKNFAERYGPGHKFQKDFSGFARSLVYGGVQIGTSYISLIWINKMHVLNIGTVCNKWKEQRSCETVPYHWISKLCCSLGTSSKCSEFPNTVHTSVIHSVQW